MSETASDTDSESESEQKTEVKPADFGPTERVVDVEDDAPAPDHAVVLNTLPIPANEWTIYRIKKTVHEDNPDYPTDDPVVAVAFEDHLDEALDGWRDYEGYWSISELHERDVRYYVFPASRLRSVDDQEADSEE